jgi:DsbC/DsbD-like thiol-disulfide interchange protein
MIVRGMRPKSLRLIIGFTLMAALAPAARAQSSAASDANRSHAKVELIAAQNAALPNTPFWVGLQFELDPGWHIYWQNAGDSGEPPKVQWLLPPGFKAGEILWPAPKRLGSGTIIDYGYEGTVLLMAPIRSPAKSAAAPVAGISADVKYVVCSEICIPGKAHLALSLPTSNDLATRKTLFARTRARMPKAMPPDWRANATSDKNNFTLLVHGASRERSATFFPLTPGQIENSAPQRFESLADGFRLTLKKSDQFVAPARWLKGLLILGDGNSYEVAARIEM